VKVSPDFSRLKTTQRSDLPSGIGREGDGESEKDSSNDKDDKNSDEAGPAAQGADLRHNLASSYRRARSDVRGAVGEVELQELPDGDARSETVRPADMLLRISGGSRSSNGPDDQAEVGPRPQDVLGLGRAQAEAALLLMAESAPKCYSSEVHIQEVISIAL